MMTLAEMFPNRKSRVKNAKPQSLKARPLHRSDPLYVRLFAIQSGVCFHCRKPMGAVRAPINPQGWTYEHVIPLSAGGSRGANNVVLAHSKCNAKRGSIPFSPDDLDRASALIARAAIGHVSA